MDIVRVFQHAISSLLSWDERDPDKLRYLLDCWEYRQLVSDDLAEVIIWTVAKWPVTVH